MSDIYQSSHIWFNDNSVKCFYWEHAFLKVCQCSLVFYTFTDQLGCKWTFQMKLAFWVFGCEYSVLHIKNAVGSPCWQGLKRLFFQERNLRVRCLLKIQWKRTRAYGVKTASNTLWIKQILIWISCCTQKGFRAHIYIFSLKNGLLFLQGGK